MPKLIGRAAYKSVGRKTPVKRRVIKNKKK